MTDGAKQHPVAGLMNDAALQRTREEVKRQLMDQAFYASIILIDLTNSTGIKQKKPFPEWISTIEDFYDRTTKAFGAEKIEPVKLLGDAVLFLIPDATDRRAQKYIAIQQKHDRMVATPDHQTLLRLCVETKESWWEAYREYLEHEESKENYMAITIALDYGLVVDFNLSKDGANPDPLGTAVDRCFRISSVAGPGHILFSEAFSAKLPTDCGVAHLSIAVSDTFLKGVEPQKHLHYVVPSKTEEEWILSEGNRALIEETARPMIHKVKLQLLRKRLAELKVPGENR